MRNKKQLIPTGNFIFKNKANAKGKRTLYLRYYVNGEAVVVSTGVSVDPADWDCKREQVKIRNISHARLNQKLWKQREIIENRIASYTGRLTPTVLRQIMNGGHLTPDEIYAKEKRKDFIDYALEYNELRYDSHKIAFSTFHNDNYNINMFRIYIAETTGEIVMPLNELSLELFDNYKKYCLNRGNQKQSINKKLKPLFKTVEYAAKNDLIKSSVAYSICDSYFDLRKRKYEAEVEKEEIHYLTEQQLQEFVNMYPKMTHNRTREYMDMFMFAFYACGLRFSDLLTLEWNHIDWEEKQIKKNLYKEKVGHRIPLNDSAMKILRRWEEKEYNDRFVFDMLPENFDLNDQLALDNKRKSKNRALQTSLREIGRKLPTELDFNLSIHVARHTYAVIALDSGMSIDVLSKLLGHKSVTSTEKFYAKHLYHNLVEEARSKLDHIFR